MVLFNELFLSYLRVFYNIIDKWCVIFGVNWTQLGDGLDWGYCMCGALIDIKSNQLMMYVQIMLTNILKDTWYLCLQTPNIPSLFGVPNLKQ